MIYVRTDAGVIRVADPIIAESLAEELGGEVVYGSPNYDQLESSGDPSVEQPYGIITPPIRVTPEEPGGLGEAPRDPDPCPRCTGTLVWRHNSMQCPRCTYKAGCCD